MRLSSRSGEWDRASAHVAQPFVARAWFVYTLATEAPTAVLPNPVASRRLPRLIDSWGNPRSGGRTHQGIDIFAPKDTPVVSTTSGIVTRVGSNRLGGQVVHVLPPEPERPRHVRLTQRRDVLTTRRAVKVTWQ